MARGRGRGRGRGGRAAVASLPHQVPVQEDGKAAEERPASSSRMRGESGLFAPLSAPLQPKETPSSLAEAAAVVVVVPRGRMITRSLLRGTSAVLDECEPLANTTAKVGGRKALSSSPPPASVASPNPLTNGNASGDRGEASVVPPPRIIVGGVLRCICNAFLVSPSETLLECMVCRNWCHPACVGVDHGELRQYQRLRNYACPYCVAPSPPPSTPYSSGPVTTVPARDPPPLSAAFSDPALQSQHSYSSVELASPLFASSLSGDFALHDLAPMSPTFSTVPPQSPTPRQLPLKLREVADALPSSPTLTQELHRLLDQLQQTAIAMGYEAVFLPEHHLSNDEVQQCVECCAEAVQDATFSPDYPAYCIKEVRQQLHPYLQGTLLRELDLPGHSQRRIASLVLSNGHDVYGNLRPTITQLKSALQRGYLHPRDVTSFMQDCMAITDVSDFIHISLSATHVAHQRRGLAKLLMAMELLRWALRGRSRAFLNMAIEKRLVEDGTRVEYGAPAASRRLYKSFGFQDVYPRYDSQTKKERWTAKEVDMGRVMANLQFVTSVTQIAQALPAKLLSNRGAGSKAASASPNSPSTDVTHVVASNISHRTDVGTGDASNGAMQGTAGEAVSRKRVPTQWPDGGAAEDAVGQYLSHRRLRISD